MNRHKRGDTWRYIHVADIRNTAGALVDLTGWTLLSQLRKGGSAQADGEIIATFTCSWTNVGTQEFQTLLANTAAWPIGNAEFDVQFTSPGGEVVSWPTVTVEIVKDITIPA